ncbi:MAG: 23S rRNA (guanosine(2251)-2'-O)-methyltransferase RlmB [Alphaproteobacteria bacterium]
MPTRRPPRRRVKVDPVTGIKRPIKDEKSTKNKGRKPRGRKQAAPDSGHAADLLYGFHACRAAWLNPRRRINCMWITRESAAQFEDTLKTAAKQGLKRPAPMVVPRHDLISRLPEGAIHQGIAIDAHTPPVPEWVELQADLAKSDEALVVMLDQVTDPHNVGAVMRTAAAFGARAIIVQDRHAPRITGVLARSASGAVDHVPMVRVPNLSRALSLLQNAGMWTVGFSERASTRLTTGLAARKLCLVLGSEGTGLRRLVAEHCDALVRLPTRPVLPTLNVSNAAAIAMYEAQRQMVLQRGDGEVDE